MNNLNILLEFRRHYIHTYIYIYVNYFCLSVINSISLPIKILILMLLWIQKIINFQLYSDIHDQSLVKYNQNHNSKRVNHWHCFTKGTVSQWGKWDWKLESFCLWFNHLATVWCQWVGHGYRHFQQQSFSNTNLQICCIKC